MLLVASVNKTLEDEINIGTSFHFWNETKNVAEFLDPSLKTLPFTKISPVSCENHFFFLLFWNVATFIKSYCVFLQYDDVISLLESCNHYFFLWIQSVVVLIQNYLYKSKLLWKVKSDSAVYDSDNFCYCSFLVWLIFSPLVDIQLKPLSPLCWAYSWLIFFRVNW